MDTDSLETGGPVIKYLGSKRRLLPLITSVAKKIRGHTGGQAKTVLDVFSGTARVGHALKREDFQVKANDHNAYAWVLAGCYVEADLGNVRHQVTELIDEFNRLPGKRGYFTDTFCVRSRFFHPDNGAKIDAIRDAIEAKSLSRPVRNVILTSLMEAADAVDSTVGVQMAYLKRWAPRALKPMRLRMPDVLPRASAGRGEACPFDALGFAHTVRGDIAYLDPPYNQHKYLGNYHIWETLCLWDKPEFYGVACKRVDCKTRKSPYNSRPQAETALSTLIEAIQAPWLIVSFSDEGFVARESIESMLSARGEVTTLVVDQDRYVGSKIGVYNPAGERVGVPGRKRNREMVFVVGPEPIVLDQPSG